MATEASEARPTPAPRPAAERDSILAGMARARSGAPEPAADDEETPRDEAPNEADEHDDEVETPVPKPKRKAKPEPEPDEDDEPAAEVEPEPEDPEPEAEPEVEPEEPAAEPEPEPDPEVERRAAQLRRQELRQREAAKREREAITRERESLRADRQEIEQYKALKARAKYDPAGVLRHMGLTDDDMAPAAKQIYSFAKEAAADPKNREAVERMMLQRQKDAEIDELKQWKEGIEREKREARERDEQIRHAQRFLGAVHKAVKPGTLAAHFTAKGGKSAEKVTQMFAAITNDLAEDGDLPLHADVVAEYERRRREELEEAGVDVAALLKKPTAKPAVVAKPGTAAPAKSNGKTATPAAPKKSTSAVATIDARRAQDPEAFRDSLLAEMERKRRKGENFD